MFQRAVCRAVVRPPSFVKSLSSSSVSTSAATLATRSTTISLPRSAPFFARPSCRSFSSSFPSSSSSFSFSLLRHTNRQSIGHHCHVRSFASQAVKVPSMGDSITEGTVVQWAKNVGEAVAADEVLVVIETDKVSVDIRAPVAGVLTGQKAVKGQVIKVGDEIAVVDTDVKPTVSAPAASKPAAAAPQPAAPATPAPAAAAPAKPATPPPAAAAAAAPKPAAASSTVALPTSGSRTSRREPLTRMRQTIAKRLKGAQNVAAMLTTFNEIDMTNIMELRNKYKDEFFAAHGVKFGFMSAFVKASTAALIKNPFVNAYMEEDALVFHDYVDVSVAVATPTGLVVPVLRNTDKMNFAQVEKALGDYAAKARKGQIALEDMVGGTFTISNGGVYGSLMGTPILNPPQSAILGMHGIFKRPVVVNDKVEVRQMMYVALTYDHRVIDGAGAVTFLKDIKAYIEDPQRLLLSL